MAQTSLRRLAQPCGAELTPGSKRPAKADQRSSGRRPRRPVTPEVAGSSPVAPGKSLRIACCVFASDARSEPTTPTVNRGNPKTISSRIRPSRRRPTNAVVSAAADAEAVVVGPCRRFPEPEAFTEFASFKEGAQGCGAARGRLPRTSGGSGEATEVPALRQAGAALRSSSSFGLTCASMARFFLRS